MCGIAGVIGRPGAAAPGAETLDALAAALAHRGPDGTGRYVAGDVAMVHTRLAIVDLEGGAQPLRDGGGAALVANGEIYNAPELRAQFGADRFATLSDCEPPLALYRRDGAGFAGDLRGMYGAALHDEAAGTLHLARDPFGIKPLYYAETPSGTAFASEPAALIAAGLVSPRLDEGARDELLALQFTTGARTVFQGIRRVLPGETLTLSAGRVAARRRHAALPGGAPEVRSEDAALATLDDALMESVAIHRRADVPYGLFLSGGVDSASVLAAMARLDERPVRAFTAYFPESTVADERKAARAVARAAGAEHREVEVTARDFHRLLPAVARALDDPAADYAALPTYKLGMAAGEELKVVLCGEGGDELFAGYGRYRALARPWWRGGARKPRAYALLAGLGVLRREPEGWRAGLDAAEAAASEGEGAAAGDRTSLQAAQAADCAEWLAHDLLLKVDRCLMAHGVEGRTPFLDPAVARVGFALPDDLKIRGRMGKWLLRRWLARALPAARPFARKRGFTVPVGAWIARSGDRLGAAVAAQPGIEEACEPAAVRALFTQGGKRALAGAWVLLFYALWHQQHMLGTPAGGDIEETLRGG